MDRIAPGSTDQSIVFALTTAGLTISDMKLGYVRWDDGDGTSFTETLSGALTALASIITAHTDNYAIYLDADATGGNKFLIRVDFPDAAFASGKDKVVCNVYDDGNNIVAHRIYELKGAVATEAKQDIIDGNVDDIETLLGTVDSKVDTIDSEVGDIKAVTDNNNGGIIDANIIQANDTAINLRALMYPENAVYVDTVNGAAGTTNYVNGTILNPCSTIASAKTIADSLGMSKFIIQNPQTSITLGASYAAGYSFIGIGEPIVDLNGQIITNCYFENMYITGTGLNGTVKMNNCRIQAVLPITLAWNCRLEDGIILNEAGSYEFVNCKDALASVAQLQMDFGAGVGTTRVLMTDFAGQIEIEKMSTDDELRLTGRGSVNFDNSNTGGTATIFGMTVTDSSATTAITIVNDPVNVLEWDSNAVTGDGDWAALSTNVDDIETLLNVVDGKIDIIDTNVDDVETNVNKLVYPNGFIYYDSSAGSTGTTLGLHGTPDNPVNDEADAITLADALGTKKVMIAGTWTEVANRDGYHFASIGSLEGLFNQGTYTCDNCVFEKLDKISGTTAVSRDNLYLECTSTSNNAYGGAAINCRLANSTFITGASFHAINCSGKSTMTINWDSTARSFWARGLSCSNVTFQGMTNSGSSAVVEFANAANITIAASCTQGWMSISGYSNSFTDSSGASCSVDNNTVKKLIDEELTSVHGAGSWASGGDATEAKQDTILANLAVVDGNVDDIETLLNVVDGKVDIIDANVDTIQVGVGYPLGAVYFDSGASNTNTVLGTDGTIDNPVSSWAAAKSLADALGSKEIIVAGQMSIDSTATGYGFVGKRQSNGSIVSSLAIAAAVVFHDCNVENLQFTSTGTSNIDDNRFLHCRVYGNDCQLGGEYVDCIIDGDQLDVQNNTIILGGSVDANDTQIQFNVDASADDFIITRFGATSIVLGNVTTNNTVAVISCKGELQIGASCTGGTIRVVGDMTVADSSGGATVNLDDNGLINWKGTEVTGDGDWAELQSDVDGILEDTDITIPALLAIIDGNVDDIETLLNTVDGKVDVVDGNVDDIEAFLKTDTLAELPATTDLPTNPTITQALMARYMMLSGKIRQSSTVQEHHNKAGAMTFKKNVSVAAGVLTYNASQVGT